MIRNMSPWVCCKDIEKVKYEQEGFKKLLKSAGVHNRIQPRPGCTISRVDTMTLKPAGS